MYSSNEELYSYTPEIPQQQNMKNGMYNGMSGTQQNNFNNYRQDPNFSNQLQFLKQRGIKQMYNVEHLENTDTGDNLDTDIQNTNATNTINTINVGNIPIIPDNIQEQKKYPGYRFSSPSEKLKSTMKYYFITLIVPLIIFVLLFVIFSLDFVKESIFNILHIQEDSDQSVSICVCALYGLLIGIVYTLLIKILERFVN